MSTMSARSRQNMVLAWSIVGIFFVVDVAWLQFGRLSFAPGTFGLVLESVATISIAYFATTAVAHRLRYDKSALGSSIHVIAERTGDLIQAGAFIIASGITGVTFSYLSASLGLPLRDADLAAVDKAIGFDWMAFLAFLNQYPILSGMLVAAYRATGAQLTFVILFLGFTRRGEPLANFLAVLALCNLMTGIVVTLVPAAGAYAYYKPAREMFSHYTASGGLWHLDVFASLRNDAAPILDFTKIQGLVSFPSFHTTLAIITAWAVRDVRYIAIPAIMLNAAVILSTLPEGGHHLVDVLAGGVVAAIAILIVEIYMRRPSLTESESRILGAWDP